MKNKLAIELQPLRIEKSILCSMHNSAFRISLVENFLPYVLGHSTNWPSCDMKLTKSLWGHFGSEIPSPASRFLHNLLLVRHVKNGSDKRNINGFRYLASRAEISFLAIIFCFGQDRFTNLLLYLSLCLDTCFVKF